MIDRFSKEQFEAALPENREYLGTEQGEHTYAVPVANSSARIKIRSTVGSDGFAADTGEDSIRMWIQVMDKDGNWNEFSKLKDELGAYTTRVPGWDRRIREKLDMLASVGAKFKRAIPVCPDCGQMCNVFISKTDRNPNRPFSTCSVRSHKSFQWLDEPGFIPQTALVDDGGIIDADKIIESVDKAVDDFFANLQEELDNRIDGGPEQPVYVPRRLNEQQQAIVDAAIDASARVLAGPGSGKTSVMEERIARLVTEDNGAEPGQILYVTFSKSMADEGAERIGRKLKSVGVPALKIAEYTQWFCTIHAACYRMLKASGDRRDIPKDWEITRMLKDTINNLWPYAESDPESRPTWSQLYGLISTAKHHGWDYRHAYAWYAEMFGEEHGEKLRVAHMQFDAWLGNKYITFGDMLYSVEKRLLEDREFRHRWQNQFKWVMVDEGQDTNAQAMRILTILAEPENRMVIVGDTDQLLYRFSGAAPEFNLYDGFSNRYPDGLTFKMETNYRSARSIIEACNKVIRSNYESGGGPYEEMFRKDLMAKEDALDGAPITFNMYEGPEEEAMAIAQEIKIMIDSGKRQPQDIFIGTRTRAQLGYFEPIMTALGIPFINITGGSFWLVRHVRATLDYIRLARNPQNGDAFKYIYNIPSMDMVNPWGQNKGQYSTTRWLGNEFLRWCNTDFSSIQCTGWGNYTVNGRKATNSWSTGLDDLFSTMDAVQDSLERNGLSATIKWIVDNVIAPWLKEEEGAADDENNYKLDDLETVMEVARRFTDIDKFLEYIDAAVQAAMDAKNKDWSKYVVLSTIHRLKGLERPVVFGPGCAEGVNPKNEMPAGLLPHTFSLVAPPKQGLFDLSSGNSVEDERCIFFVLISRAKEEVHLSAPKYYRNFEFGPSRFVNELLG